MALVTLYQTDLVLKPWMTFAAYQALNLLTSGIVMFGNRFIPAINRFSCRLDQLPIKFLCPVLSLINMFSSMLRSAGMVHHYGHSGCCSPDPQ